MQVMKQQTMETTTTGMKTTTMEPTLGMVMSRCQPPRDHPVRSQFNFEFNSMLGFDVLEMRDHLGNKYSVMSMVDIATGFHMCEVVKEGGGQPTSEACAKALMTKWIAWAGWPKACIMNRGPHNRGAVTKMLASHGCNIEFAPLETPAAIGKVERHGGLLKEWSEKWLLRPKQQDLQTLRCCCKNAHPQRTACTEQMVTVQANVF